VPRIGAERRAGRRAEILAAAEACFARLGFHRATMRDVIDEAGLSAGCVYTHFPSKRAIVEAIAAERHVREAEAIAAAGGAGGDPVEALRALAHRFLAELSTRRGLEERRLAAQTWTEALLDADVRRIVRAGVEQPLAALAALVRRAQAEGRLSPALDADALARAMVALFHGFVLQKLWDPRVAEAPYRAALDAILDALTRVAPARVRTPAARARGART